MPDGKSLQSHIHDEVIIAPIDHAELSLPGINATISNYVGTIIDDIFTKSSVPIGVSQRGRFFYPAQTKYWNEKFYDIAGNAITLENSSNPTLDDFLLIIVILVCQGGKVQWSIFPFHSPIVGIQHTQIKPDKKWKSIILVGVCGDRLSAKT